MNVHQIQRHIQKRSEGDRHYRGPAQGYAIQVESPLQSQTPGWLAAETAQWLSSSQTQELLQRHGEQIKKVPETNR